MSARRLACLVLALAVTIPAVAAPIEALAGELKLVVHPDTGSFSLYKLSEVGKNRYEPLFEDRNAGSTSWFSVYLDGRVFRLSRRQGGKISVAQTDEAIVLTFAPTDEFQVVQEFSFVRTSMTAQPFALRVVTRVENTSGKSADFALKLLLDTFLGEGEGIHFFTNVRSRVSSETRLVSGIDPDAAIVSANKQSSCMFLLSGAGATSPAEVYVSNWDRLNTLTWLPDFVPGRSFNTMYAINDSALLAVWPTKQLANNEELVVTSLIGMYTPEVIGAAPVAPVSSPKVQVPAVPSPIVEPAPAARAPASEPVASPAPVNPDYELIQQLLARIAEIERNPDSASDEELERLNRSLDEMIRRLER